MSYLLTEIALEMLGYKYYDINGICGMTNFQNLGQSKVNRSETDDQERTLQDILKLYQDCEVSSCNNESDNNYDIEIDENLQLPTPNINNEKLFDEEYERIKSQIYRNKTKFLQSSKDFIRQVEAQNTITPQEILKPFNNHLVINIQTELDTMKTFRRSVEGHLQKINPQQFEKYQKQFDKK